MSEAEELRAGALDQAISRIRVALARYKFVVRNERALQDAVISALACDGLLVEREVRGDHGAFDLRVTFGAAPPVVVVIELKLHASAAAVERQAQRYAKVDGVDAVIVATTSQRLQAALLAPRFHMLGGKPFRALALRTF